MRRICLSLGDVTERVSHSMPNWFVRNKRAFVTLLKNGHHQNQFPHFWCAAPIGVQEDLIASDPDTFFRPPYVGHMGWVGVRFDRDAPWPLVERLCQQAHAYIASKL